MDYVVCTHKAIDQDEVVTELKSVVHPSRTTIVLIQNGVGNEEPFRRQFPFNSIITCVVGFSQAVGYICIRTDKAKSNRLG
jgi:ketopantoate reductase